MKMKTFHMKISCVGENEKGLIIPTINQDKFKNFKLNENKIYQIVYNYITQIVTHLSQILAFFTG